MRGSAPRCGGWQPTTTCATHATPSRARALRAAPPAPLDRAARVAREQLASASRSLLTKKTTDQNDDT
jgi:hypothetical protein